MHNLLFVTGTDTDAGKTMVAGALIARLKQDGLLIRAIKPVESGCEEVDGILNPKDATMLAKAAGHEIDCPIRYKAPLAPSAAAVLEPYRATIDIGNSAQHLRAATATHDIVIAEGAGGLLVPLNAQDLIADLIAKSGATLLVVGRGGLGTINHTALTLEVAKQRRLPILGFVLSAQDNTPIKRVHENALAIAAISNEAFLGILPFQEQTNPKEVAAKLPDELVLAAKQLASQ